MKFITIDNWKTIFHAIDSSTSGDGEFLIAKWMCKHESLKPRFLEWATERVKKTNCSSTLLRFAAGLDDDKLKEALLWRTKNIDDVYNEWLVPLLKKDRQHRAPKPKWLKLCSDQMMVGAEIWSCECDLQDVNTTLLDISKTHNIEIPCLDGLEGYLDQARKTYFYFEASQYSRSVLVFIEKADVDLCVIRIHHAPQLSYESETGLENSSMTH